MARLAFDMDGVIVDTYVGQKDWLKSTYPELMDKADGRKFKSFLSDEQNRVFYQMMDDGKFFANLPPMDGAIEVMRNLTANHEVYIVSAGTLIPKSCSYKYDWIVKYLPFVDVKNIVFCMNKGAVLADYLMDDHVQNFRGFEGKGILFGKDQHYLDYPDRVENWAAMAQYEF